MAVSFSLPRRGARVRVAHLFLAVAMLLGFGALVAKTMVGTSCPRTDLGEERSRIAVKSRFGFRVFAGKFVIATASPWSAIARAYEVDFTCRTWCGVQAAESKAQDAARDVSRFGQEHGEGTSPRRISSRSSTRASSRGCRSSNSRWIQFGRSAAALPQRSPKFLHLSRRNRFQHAARFLRAQRRFAGVDVGVRPVRQYIYGALASHLLGMSATQMNRESSGHRGVLFLSPDVKGRRRSKSPRQIHSRKARRAGAAAECEGQIEGEIRRMSRKQGPIFTSRSMPAFNSSRSRPCGSGRTWCCGGGESEQR
jgi:hypothetical protein